jgi:hypothetical protein
MRVITEKAQPITGRGVGRFYSLLCAELDCASAPGRDAWFPRLVRHQAVAGI